MLNRTHVSRAILAVVVSAAAWWVPAAADARTETKDANADGTIDTWVTYDSRGGIEKVAIDKSRRDGKPDTWRYYRDGRIYKKEWDRNFDGRPDFRVIEEKGRFVEKQYDDDHDGTFEKIQKAPRRGSTGITKTYANQREDSQF